VGGGAGRHGARLGRLRPRRGTRRLRAVAALRSSRTLKWPIRLRWDPGVTRGPCGRSRSVEWGTRLEGPLAFCHTSLGRRALRSSADDADGGEQPRSEDESGRGGRLVTTAYQALLGRVHGIIAARDL